MTLSTKRVIRISVAVQSRPDGAYLLTSDMNVAPEEVRSINDALEIVNACDAPASENAKSASIRPVGRVVTREDLPRLGCEIGIQTEDDQNWVLDPVLMLAKGRKLYAAF